MPFQSEAQRRFMFAKLPSLANKWQQKTPKKKLPKKASHNNKTTLANIYIAKNNRKRA